MMTVYAAVIYSTLIFFMAQPTILKIIDVMLKNGTEPGVFPYPVDYYYFDAQKYYFYVTMHCYISGFMCAIPLIACDTLLIMCVQHACSVFAALGSKLAKIGNKGTSVDKCKFPFDLDKRNVVHLASLIARHNDAIEYANLIEAINTWIFFFTIAIGVIELSLTGLRIMVGKNYPESTMGYVLFMLCHLFVYYMECYISQILEDHSISIGDYIHNSRWYRLSPKTQKLLLMMTMRCRVTCQLTLGKMFIMSMRTFAATLKTSLSYFAVFRRVNDRLIAA